MDQGAGVGQAGQGGTGNTSVVQPGCTGHGRCPKEQFKQEVEKELTGRRNRTLGNHLLQVVQESAASS
jgi:hypothetical protein